MSYSIPRKYLTDPTEDVRVATETLLADFLREIRDVTRVRDRIDKQQAHTSDVKVGHSKPTDLTSDRNSLDVRDSATYSERDDGIVFDENENKDKDPDYADTGGVPDLFMHISFTQYVLSLGTWSRRQY
jgi:vacuole morphology and inheritance protein 14